MYIIIEGIDGAGKSTQIPYLKEWLEEFGLSVELVVEPTDSNVGRLIRKMLKNPDANSENMQKTLGLLFAADRLLLKEQIEKKDNGKKVIISDRSFYSSLVYQNPFEWIKTINKYVKKPDIVILMDIDPKTSLSRIKGEDTFETIDFLTSVREKYLKIANEENFKIIDASNGEKKVTIDIKKAIAPLFGICKDGIFE
ncbi:MAG: dTMP kinase [Methanobrevibacter sp.]|jgi:dTMP kinase|nr:dTMP kinase [Candidatus Methanoflexus mossambicus]